MFDMPKTLITKDVLKEGGLGIHVLKNVLHRGRWILVQLAEKMRRSVLTSSGMGWPQSPSVE